MKEILLLKCGELVLKGLNRRKFENRLMDNIRRRLKPLGEWKIYSIQSTIYIEPQGDAPIDEGAKALTNVFGIVAICRAAVCDKDINNIIEIGTEYLRETLENAKSFKVEAKRSDKKFPLKSPQISVEVGGELHEKYPHLTPDMHNPEVLVMVEIRDKNAFIYAGRIMGAGGMPVGVNGKAALLLSGGIDSPVAGYMIAKRGVELEAIHFFSYPYTSEQAKEKVLDLAKILTKYAGRIIVHVVPFTEIQEQMRRECPEDLFTVIMRRFMMRIAEKIAIERRCSALITGESLGQVASQTMHAMHATGIVCDMPILRPVIGMDKEEIIQISRKIDTFETSILPYEDCCTVFTPKHPDTKPRLYKVEAGEKTLDIDKLVNDAIERVERVVIEL